MNYIFVLIPVLILWCIAGPIWIPWSTHLEMTKSHSKTWGWGNFKMFLREFNSRKWKRQQNYPLSYFSDPYGESEIHASIIQFGDKGMCLDLISYWKFWFEIRKYRLDKKKPENWK